MAIQPQFLNEWVCSCKLLLGAKVGCHRNRVQPTTSPASVWQYSWEFRFQGRNRHQTVDLAGGLAKCRGPKQALIYYGMPRSVGILNAEQSLNSAFPKSSQNKISFPAGRSRNCI